MGNAIAAVIGLATLLVCWEIWRCSKVGFRRLEITLDASELGGAKQVRILHLSDIHLTGPTAHRLEQISFLKGRSWDFILVSGDLIDNDSGITPVCDFIAGLHAVCGRFAVLGNHDYHRVHGRNPIHWIAVFIHAGLLGEASGYTIPNDVDQLVRQLDKSNIKLLRNELAGGELPGGGSYQVFGIDDPSTGRDNPGPLLSLADPRALRLVMTHSPRRIGLLAPLRPAIVLSGHTHGGQVRLPFLGALATHSDARRRECSGLVRMEGLRVHISPGFGAGRLMPMRFLVPCEVTEIILRAADTDK